MHQPVYLEFPPSWSPWHHPEAEMILATLRALADGKIMAEEMPIEPRTNPKTIRFAPGFSTMSPATQSISRPYTIDALAKFLGAVGEDGHATDDFKAAFSALELIEEGVIEEADIQEKALYQVGPYVTLYKTHRDANLKDQRIRNEQSQKALVKENRRQGI